MFCCLLCQSTEIVVGRTVGPVDSRRIYKLTAIISCCCCNGTNAGEACCHPQSKGIVFLKGSTVFFVNVRYIGIEVYLARSCRTDICPVSKGGNHADGLFVQRDGQFVVVTTLANFINNTISPTRQDVIRQKNLVIIAIHILDGCMKLVNC